ncbi:MAG: 4-(cytidine 5'-diphospho)-2-C-methyl-D-erythritol kinase [Candidatus Symbiothrix sp.]|jgi:4-diphosphocytidyl-2-C-methyl-D-erythritol kinase|nr:4-(cytidine 5'-diphospho)-2-C-methyl-D-erythritol kinase [Candidatus Symbiothrix sp.]
MLVFPNAKINLGLNVVARRPDGYHDIETVFYPIPVCDALEMVPAVSGSTTFSPSGIAVDCAPETNLVMKAYRLLQVDFPLPEVDIYLQKHIPFGAGLGGGSADAAFALRLLNDFADLHLSTEQLENYAVKIGADCPFFIRDMPVFAQGIGNIFSQIDLSLAGYYFVLVKPDIHVSTQAAYQGVKAQAPKESVIDIIRRPVDTWHLHLHNDFENGVFAQYPAIGQIKEALYRQGAIYAAMSGSGSAVFGLFYRELDVASVFPDCWVFGDYLWE